jgi:hypothetical protein
MLRPRKGTPRLRQASMLVVHGICALKIISVAFLEG